MKNLAEFQRLDVLRGMQVLDTPADARLDTITILAKMYFDVPIALISLVDDCRQWFKSRQGLAATETHRDLAFCHYAIQQAEPMVIPDALLDDRFATNELVTGDPFIRFYAGAPIIIDGFALGTVCIIDSKPRELDSKDVKQLAAIAEMAASFLKTYRSEDVSEFQNKSALLWERDEALKEATEARRHTYESSEFLELILENIPDIIYVKDSQLKHVRGNTAFFNIFPKEFREKLIGSTGMEFVPDKSLIESYLEQDELALKSGFSDITHKIPFLRNGADTFSTKRIRFEDQAGDSFVLGISRDISQIVKTEKAVLEAKEFQDLMFEHMPDMVFVKDDQFRIVQANDKFLQLYPEHYRDSVIGSTTLEQYTEEERHAFLTEDRKALEDGFSEIEEDIHFPNGDRRILLTRKVRFKDQENHRFVLGIGRDITELVEARRKHEQSLELLDSVINTVTSAVIGLNADGKIITINKAGRKMLAGEIAETPFAWPDEIVFLDPSDMHPLEASHDPIQRAMSDKKISGEVHLMTRKSGRDHTYVRVSSAHVKSDASPLDTVIVLDDVSEAERNRQSAERQSRLDALGQLTGGIAHDFNNLLNTMQYALELLGREELSERGVRSANAAAKSIQRGTELTNRLLAFAKKQPARSTTRSLQEVVSELQELVLPVMEASVKLEFGPVDDDLFVYCDQGQLQNAILNLVINSRDAIISANKGDLIKVDFRSFDELPDQVGGVVLDSAKDRSSKNGSSHRFIEIAVSDNGPGMPDAVAARAVDPFFTTKDVHSGSGLGLSMVYGFVEQSDGELRIYTEEGTGTTIRIFLPRGDHHEGAEGPVAMAPLKEGNGETVLIVEDEDFLLEQLDELLKELNYNTVQARSGRAAIDMIKAGVRADLILTDVVMPGGIGGFELARMAREISPDIPIIYMSGYTGFTDEEMGAVVAPLLPKPSSPSATSNQIRCILDEAKRRQSEYVEATSQN